MSRPHIFHPAERALSQTGYRTLRHTSFGTVLYSLSGPCLFILVTLPVLVVFDLFGIESTSSAVTAQLVANLIITVLIVWWRNRYLLPSLSARAAAVRDNGGAADTTCTHDPNAWGRPATSAPSDLPSLSVPGSSPARTTRTKHLVTTVLCAVAAVWFTGQFAAAWFGTFGTDTAYEQTKETFAAADVWLLLGLTLVAAPLAEEAMCRGALYPVLRGRFGVAVSALVSGFAFAVLHGNMTQAIYTVGFGVVSALVYEITGRLRWSVILHSGANVLAVIVPSGLFTGVAGSAAAPVVIVVGLVLTGVAVLRLTTYLPDAPAWVDRLLIREKKLTV